jgi:hypothetical protein
MERIQNRVQTSMDNKGHDDISIVVGQIVRGQTRASLLKSQTMKSPKKKLQTTSQRTTWSGVLGIGTNMMQSNVDTRWLWPLSNCTPKQAKTLHPR